MATLTWGTIPDCNLEYAHYRITCISRHNWAVECTCGWGGDNALTRDKAEAFAITHRLKKPATPDEYDKLVDFSRRVLAVWCDRDMILAWCECVDCPFPDGPSEHLSAARWLCERHRVEAQRSER